MPTATRRYRTIFISDLHLGFRGCRAAELLDFLAHHHSDTLYLVGDIVDLWSMRSSFYWPPEHHEVLRTILARAAAGTRVVYVPGNHDDLMRDFDGMTLANVEIRNEYLHETADGRRLLVLHGDQFDAAVKFNPLLAAIGGRAYELLLWANRLINRLRRLCGLPYWSLATCLKERVRNAVDYIGRFERALALAARQRGVDGIVCGHIHRAGLHEIDDVLYCNDGDWVESCSSLVEDRNGRLQLLRWAGAGRETQPATGTLERAA